jgi:hypothetical protein
LPAAFGVTDAAFTVAPTVRTTFGAAAYVAFPACDAVSTQSTVPLVIVTVPPAIVHPPDGVTVTASPELAVGATPNVLPYTAGVVGCTNVIVCAPPPVIVKAAVLDVML